ncbi:hypothetical protein BS47DRAFT_1356721, partial [Hydnum rufescens UP504]
MELEERRLREEEDRMFREAATKDRERIHKSNRPSPVRSRRASTDRNEAKASNNVRESDDSRTCLWRSSALDINVRLPYWETLHRGSLAGRM